MSEPKTIIVPQDAPIIVAVPYDGGVVEVAVGREASLTLPDGQDIHIIRKRDPKHIHQPREGKQVTKARRPHRIRR